MPSLPFFINCLEGESSASVPSSQFYRPAQHHKQLIPHNFQPYSQQNICLLIVLVQEGFLLKLVQANTEIIKLTDSCETIGLQTSEA